MYAVDNAVERGGTVLDRVLIREIGYMCFGKARVILRMSVVLIENESCVGTLIFKYGALRVDVILKVPVLIKMVRRQVRYHRNVRGAFHAVQLERTELQHGDVVRANIWSFAE